MDLNQINLNNNDDNDDNDNITSILSSTSSNGNHLSFNSSVWNSGISIGNSVFGIEDLKSIFILMMKDLKESYIENILNIIKEKQPDNYNHCLINLIAYPNFKLMSEEFMINRYEDIKTAMQNTHKHINFNLTYGNLLDKMPGFKLLLKI
jgi:hypothetical protein